MIRRSVDRQRSPLFVRERRSGLFERASLRSESHAKVALRLRE